jgi:SAM-dependent methyltransferase
MPQARASLRARFALVMARMSLATTPTNEHCLACGKLARAEGGAVACAACGLSLVRGNDGVLSPVATASTLIRNARRAEPEVSYPETGADAMASVEDTSFWFAHRNEVVALLLERFAPGRTLWDIGGGNGFQAMRLQQRGRSVVLVEPGITGCRNAVARRVAHVIHGTIESLGLAAASLDAISLLDVIEHLPDPVQMLAECRRILRPSGRLFVTVPAYQALWSDEDEFAQHHRRYDRALLLEHLRLGGFDVELVSYFFQPLVAPIFLLRSLPHRLSRRRRTENDTADLSEHGTGGLSQRVMEALLSRELRALRHGRSLSFGSSLVAVAR